MNQTANRSTSPFVFRVERADAGPWNGGPSQAIGLDPDTEYVAWDQAPGNPGGSSQQIKEHTKLTDFLAKGMAADQQLTVSYGPFAPAINGRLTLTGTAPDVAACLLGIARGLLVAA